jgi:hypothetical protein
MGVQQVGKATVADRWNANFVGLGQVEEVGMKEVNA